MIQKKYEYPICDIYAIEVQTISLYKIISILG